MFGSIFLLNINDTRQLIYGFINDLLSKNTNKEYPSQFFV